MPENKTTQEDNRPADLSDKIGISEIKEIMKITGKIRGISLKGEIKYILDKKKEEGVRAFEKETEKLGYLIEYKKIKETEWYPVGLRMVSISAMFSVFNWGRAELAEIAESLPKISFIMKFFMKYFTSKEKILRKAATKIWKRYYNVGSLEAVDFKETKKDGYAILRIKNFKLHPLYCFFLGHFFIGVIKLADPRIRETTVEEIKCMFRGDKFHEYLIKWVYK